MMEEDEHFTEVCSAATLQSKKEGFFQSYADNVMDLAGQQWLDEFKQLTSDNERLLKCYNDERLYEAIHRVLQNVQHIYRGKAGRLSQLRRWEGEKAARDSKHSRALILLTQAIVRAPQPGAEPSVDEGLSLPLALWSRALTLWHLSEYRLCLVDLQLCLKEKLPEKHKVEAYWRMAQCYKELGEPAKAKVSLQVTLKMLGPEEIGWRGKIETEMKTLPSTKKQDKETGSGQDSERLLEGEHPQLPGVTSAVSVCSSEATGRYVVASQLIHAGDVLAIQQPHVSCLLVEKFVSHCHHCYVRIRSAVACKQCAALAFCSPSCRESAEVYHRHECRYMDLMIGSGMSVLCHMALRTVTQQSYTYWQKVYAKHPVSPDYNRMATLVTHADKRQPRDFVSRTLMALFLLRILEHSQYIPPKDCHDDKLTGMPLFLGSVLLHLLQCLQFNAHEIYETMYKTNLDFTSSKINYIAVGVYTSVALFNHDCYPAVTRYFRGKELVVRAVRPLKLGELIAENYGPVYTMRGRAERQRTLQSRYWFTCGCTACQEDWPKFTEFDVKLAHIRCSTKDCDGYITTTTEPKKPKAKCPKCTAAIDVAEKVLLVKSYNIDFDQGMSLMGEGQLMEAAQLFTAFSDVMHVICRPPVKNVSVAHEAMRSCWCYNYNKFVMN